MEVRTSRIVQKFGSFNHIIIIHLMMVNSFYMTSKLSRIWNIFAPLQILQRLPWLWLSPDKWMLNQLWGKSLKSLAFKNTMLCCYNRNTLGKQKSTQIGCQSSLPLVTLSPCQAQQANRSCKSFDDCDIFETNNDTTFLLPTLITLLYDGSAASCFSSWEKGLKDQYCSRKEEFVQHVYYVKVLLHLLAGLPRAPEEQSRAQHPWPPLLHSAVFGTLDR